jgi:transcriptional regulator of acetoin/glycerol metabolism
MAARIVPHDEAELIILSDGGSECLHAAMGLGLSRTQLYIRMRRYGIDEPRDG